MSEHHCPNCDESSHPGTGPRISSASIHRSMEDAARDQRIREAERVVLAAAERAEAANAALNGDGFDIDDLGTLKRYLSEPRRLADSQAADEGVYAAVRALREARKEVKG